MLTRQSAMHVVESACSWSADLAGGRVVIESDNPDFPRAIQELSGMGPRHMAVAFAVRKGMPKPQINGNMIGPYAVNEDFVPLDLVSDHDSHEPLPPQHRRMQPAFFRVEVPVYRSDSAGKSRLQRPQKTSTARTLPRQVQIKRAGKGD